MHFLILLLSAFFVSNQSIAQSQGTSIDLTTFVYDASGNLVWPGTSNVISEVSSIPTDPVISGNTILTQLNSTGGNTYMSVSAFQNYAQSVSF